MCSRISLLLGVVVLSLIAASVGMSEVPRLLNYQGHLSAGDGSPLDTTVAMTFIICEDSLGASVLWSEEQSTVTVTEGMFAVLLGSVNPVEPDVFSGDTRWLGLQVGDGPMQDTLMPIVSVAYAYRSQSSDSAGVAATTLDALWSTDGNNIYYIGGNVGIGTLAGEVSLGVATGVRFEPHVPSFSCGWNTEGTVVFCPLLKELCYCDGNAWMQVDGGGTCDPGLDVGDLVITELMDRWTYEIAPWIEITNVSDHTLELTGLSLIINGFEETISQDLWIEGGEALTFGHFSSCFEPDYELWVEFDIEYNLVQFRDKHYVFDELEFDQTWPLDPPGHTMQLDIRHYSASENDNIENWCVSEPFTLCEPGGLGYYGTPGEPNLACPE